MNPTSFTLFVNLCIVKFLNDIVIRGMLNNPSSARRSARSGNMHVYDIVVPDTGVNNTGSVPYHDYFTPSGTITLLTFYFTYLICSMIYREEINILRIVLYIVLLVLVILFKTMVLEKYPIYSVVISLIIGILFGIIASILVGSMNISLLPSGINEKACPNVPVVSCAYKQDWIWIVWYVYKQDWIWMKRINYITIN